MKKNVGKLDSIIRVGLSIFLILFVYTSDILFEDQIAAGILLVIAVMNFFVATVKVCPLYTLANVDTRKHKEKTK